VPARKFGWTEAELDGFLPPLWQRCVVAPPTEAVRICDDPDDNWNLECAQSVSAGFIVTGDDDLLRLGLFGGTQIVTPRAFLDAHTLSLEQCERSPVIGVVADSNVYISALVLGAVPQRVFDLVENQDGFKAPMWMVSSRLFSGNASIWRPGRRGWLHRHSGNSGVDRTATPSTPGPRCRMTLVGQAFREPKDYCEYRRTRSAGVGRL